ncbi:transcriptional attenuator, LytR family [Marinococcus luteus]|uniref:Transcriptional attenuator, LytR family n=1 Tax=Marinococcus luteus TaxID=1122204 RepID=A0A1H2VFZ8_9BACI|nr:LCP family protein [Marinococcus luteus]SDW67263.1 transcriptional attenuator, LytR family [Marinococcus luteus]
MRNVYLFFMITFLLTCFLSLGGLFYYYYTITAGQKEKITLETAPEDSSTVSGPQIILIAGTDKEETASRADVIMIISIHSGNESTLLFNIPRDTKVSIPGRDGTDKINHAYRYAGMPLLKKTAEEFLDTPIDFTVEADMKGFREVVDAYGGVTVQNDLEFVKDEGDPFTYTKGNLQLNGDQALYYVRMRKQDPRGDLGRNLRQQQVLEALLEKAKSPATLQKAEELLYALGDHIHMDMTFRDIRSFSYHYTPALTQIQTTEIQGVSAEENGISYYLVSSEEQGKAQLRLDRHQAGKSY